MRRVCSETTWTPRTWKREKHGENTHKRNISLTEKTETPQKSQQMPLKNI